MRAIKILRLGLIFSLCLYTIAAISIGKFKYFLVSFLTTQPMFITAATDYFNYIGLSYIGLGPMVVYLVVLEQTGSGAKSLLINFFYLMLPTVIGGCLALHFNNYHILYALVAVINFLSLILIGLTCFQGKSPIKKLAIQI